MIQPLRKLDDPEICVQRLFICGYTQGCSMIFTDKVKQYLAKMNLQYIPMHDIVLMLYAMHCGKVYWDAQPHFSYRVHANNVVAKNNKSFLQKIQTTYWNWKNSSRNSMAFVADEMLKNILDMPQEERNFLQRIKEYKKHRLSLLWNCPHYDADSSAVRSYRIRILLGLY